jgi:hypothetical protein
MAYEIKYRITAATKSDVTSVVNIYEDGYDGEIIEYPCISLQLQYIPRSDDAFEPIYVSQLSVAIDVTDNVEDMPDFTTLNDRKYFVEVLSGENVDFIGWVLSDNVQYVFSTGRKDLYFNAIDGLGMLETIPLPLSDETELIYVESAKDLISIALGQIGYPIDYKIISGVSFYSEDMDNRTDDPAADGLAQSYINYATFINDNQTATNCLDVLTRIAKSFGSRLFQAKGNFYIVPLTQFAQDSYYATIYNSDGTIFDDIIISDREEIQGFAANTSGLYFVDNSQFKLIRKGYNKVRFNKVVEYPNNYITNWNLKTFTVVSPTVSNAFSWLANRNGGTIYVKSQAEKKYNAWYIDYPTASPHFSSVTANNLPFINPSEVIKLSFDFATIGAVSGTPDALFLLKLQVQPVGGNAYFLNQDKNWSIAVNPNDPYYYFPYWGASPVTNFTIEAAPCPIFGQLYMEIIMCSSSSGFWKSTVKQAEISNFNMKIDSFFKEVTTESYINDVEEYVLDIDLPMGFNDINEAKYNYTGYISKSDGSMLLNWYRQEFPDKTYRSLSELIVQQYSNCFNKNIINLDASFMGMETDNGRFSGAMRINATDLDPVQISVTNKKYIIGNSTIDLPNDVITATLLDINPNNVETTMTTVYDSNPLSRELTGFGHQRSNGYLTKEAALAGPLTSNLVYLDQVGVPSVGDFFYQSEFLTVGFNGANIWWRVLVTDSYSQAYRISGAGEILETYG